MITPIMYVLLSFVPSGIVAGLLELWRRFSHPHRRALPIKDRLLRPPGETSRQKMEHLNDKIDEVAIWVVGFPSTLLVCYLSSTGTASGGPFPSIWISALLLGGAAFAILTWKLISLIKERNNWRLRFSGERAVGEVLNQLLSEGCRVFHDVPLGGEENLDHVVIGPSGIYAVATHTERKVGASPSQQAHEAIYDGKTLQFPFHSSERDVRRAREKAGSLARFLTSSIGESFPVKAILTLPGWYVIYRGLGEVMVLNPKMIDTAILTQDAPALTAEQVHKIAGVFDEKCRDVEF